VTLNEIVLVVATAVLGDAVIVYTFVANVVGNVIVPVVPLAT
jgi:hypothetical protein